MSFRTTEVLAAQAFFALCRILRSAAQPFQSGPQRATARPWPAPRRSARAMGEDVSLCEGSQLTSWDLGELDPAFGPDLRFHFRPCSAHCLDLRCARWELASELGAGYALDWK